MDSIRLQAAAQELVDLTKKSRQIEDDILQLKLYIYEQAKGEIQCLGGKVTFNPALVSSEIDEELLCNQLKHRFRLSESDIDNLLASSRTTLPSYPSVDVYLE